MLRHVSRFQRAQLACIDATQRQPLADECHVFSPSRSPLHGFHAAAA
jgi:hypothetical protein